MFTLILLVLAGVVAAKMADIEDRNPVVWGLIAFAFGWNLTAHLGVFPILAPLLTLVAVFIALGVARYVDLRRKAR